MNVESPTFFDVGEILVVVGDGFETETLALLVAVPPVPVHEMSYTFVPTLVGVTVSTPLVAFDPDQSPEAVQLVAFVLDHVRSEVFPKVIDVGKDEIVAVGARAFTVNVCELDVPPPGPVVTTVIKEVVAVSKSLEGIVASNCVPEIYEVVRGELLM